MLHFHTSFDWINRTLEKFIAVSDEFVGLQQLIIVVARLPFNIAIITFALMDSMFSIDFYTLQLNSKPMPPAVII